MACTRGPLFSKHGSNPCSILTITILGPGSYTSNIKVRRQVPKPKKMHHVLWNEPLNTINTTHSPGSHSPGLGLRIPGYLIPPWSLDRRLKTIAKVLGTENFAKGQAKRQGS